MHRRSRCLIGCLAALLALIAGQARATEPHEQEFIRAAPPYVAAAKVIRAAKAGNVRAQAVLGWMYANGRGVQQSYAEAGKWWIKAAEGGDLKAARHAWNLYRNGEGVDRNPAIANQWAKMIGEPIQVPRAATAAPAAPAKK